MNKAQGLDKLSSELIQIMQFTETVAARLHGQHEEKVIFNIVEEEFLKSGKYGNSVLLLTEDKKKMRIVFTVHQHLHRLNEAEKATGLKYKSFKIPIKKSGIYPRVLYKGETIHISVPDIIAEILPRPIAKLASKIMRYTGKYSVLTALTRFGEPIGVFSMDAPKLADHFIPSAKSLARHISRALETAFEYERRMAAEAALIESEEKYHTFVRDSAYGYFELDLEGQITYLNTRSAEITGYSENEIKEIHFSKIIVPEELQKAYQGLQLAGSAGYQGPREYQILTKQGHIKSVEVNTLPLKKDNAMIGFMGTILDITQRKLAEKALKKSHDELETEVQDRTSALKDANIRLKNELTERNRAEKALFKAKAELERQYKELKKVDKIKDGLIRDVAHELKTPVAKHAMQLDLLKEAVPQQPVTRTIFKVMDASIRRQEHVIRNILDLSRLEAGGRKYKRKSIRVDEIINRVLL
jgi:PAS domain S-box-containing protein